MRSLHVYTPGVGATTIEVPKTDRYTEIRSISEQVAALFSEDDWVFYEEPLLAGPRNIRTLIGMAQTSAALLSGSSAHCYEVPVAKWKKEVVGKGNATKDDVADWLLSNHETIYSECGNQNHIDAACVHLYGKLVMDRLSLPV